MEGRITPEQFRRLKTGEIFTFGANEAFRHGKGSAKTALKWGAIYFKGPFCGNTYGICTKDKNIKTLSLDKIKVHVDNFIAFTKDHPDLTFLVVKIGCMLAGYKPKDIAPLFCFKNILWMFSL